MTRPGFFLPRRLKPEHRAIARKQFPELFKSLPPPPPGRLTLPKRLKPEHLQMALRDYPDLFKEWGHKYIRRWRGPDGRWMYAYATVGHAQIEHQRERRDPTGPRRRALQPGARRLLIEREEDVLKLGRAAFETNKQLTAILRGRWSTAQMFAHGADRRAHTALVRCLNAQGVYARKEWVEQRLLWGHIFSRDVGQSIANFDAASGAIFLGEQGRAKLASDDPKDVVEGLSALVHEILHGMAPHNRADLRSRGETHDGRVRAINEVATEVFGRMVVRRIVDKPLRIHAVGTNPSEAQRAAGLSYQREIDILLDAITQARLASKGGLST